MHPLPNPLDGEAPSLTGEVRVNARDFSVCIRKKFLALYIYRPLNSMCRLSFPYIMGVRYMYNVGLLVKRPICTLAHCCTIFLSHLGIEIQHRVVTLYTLGQIRNGAAEAKLYQVGPVFFCKKGGVYIFQSKAFFWGHVGHFFGPWDRFSKNEGGFPKRRGDFML